MKPQRKHFTIAFVFFLFCSCASESGATGSLAVDACNNVEMESGVVLAGTYLLSYSSTPQAAVLKAGQSDPYATTGSTVNTTLQFSVSVEWVGCNGGSRVYSMSAAFQSCTNAGTSCGDSVCWWSRMLPYASARFVQSAEGAIDPVKVQTSWDMTTANVTEDGGTTDVEAWAAAMCPHESEAITLSEGVLHTITQALEVKMEEQSEEQGIKASAQSAPKTLLTSDPDNTKTAGGADFGSGSSQRSRRRATEDGAPPPAHLPMAFNTETHVSHISMPTSQRSLKGAAARVMLVESRGHLVPTQGVLEVLNGGAPAITASKASRTAVVEVSEAQALTLQRHSPPSSSSSSTSAQDVVQAITRVKPEQASTSNANATFTGTRTATSDTTQVAPKGARRLLSAGSSKDASPHPRKDSGPGAEAAAGSGWHVLAAHTSAVITELPLSFGAAAPGALATDSPAPTGAAGGVMRLVVHTSLQRTSITTITTAATTTTAAAAAEEPALDADPATFLPLDIIGQAVEAAGSPGSLLRSASDAYPEGNSLESTVSALRSRWLASHDAATAAAAAAARARAATSQGPASSSQPGTRHLHQAGGANTTTSTINSTWTDGFVYHLVANTTANVSTGSEVLETTTPAVDPSIPFVADMAALSEVDQWQRRSGAQHIPGSYPDDTTGAPHTFSDDSGNPADANDGSYLPDITASMDASLTLTGAADLRPGAQGRRGNLDASLGVSVTASFMGVEVPDLLSLQMRASGELGNPGGAGGHIIASVYGSGPILDAELPSAIGADGKPLPSECAAQQRAAYKQAYINQAKDGSGATGIKAPKFATAEESLVSISIPVAPGLSDVTIELHGVVGAGGAMTTCHDDTHDGASYMGLSGGQAGWLGGYVSVGSLNGMSRIASKVTLLRPYLLMSASWNESSAEPACLSLAMHIDGYAIKTNTSILWGAWDEPVLDVPAQRLFTVMQSSPGCTAPDSNLIVPVDDWPRNPDGTRATNTTSASNATDIDAAKMGSFFIEPEASAHTIASDGGSTVAVDDNSNVLGGSPPLMQSPSLPATAGKPGGSLNGLRQRRVLSTAGSTAMGSPQAMTDGLTTTGALRPSSADQDLSSHCRSGGCSGGGALSKGLPQLHSPGEGPWERVAATLSQTTQLRVAARSLKGSTWDAGIESHYTRRLSQSYSDQQLRNAAGQIRSLVTAALGSDGVNPVQLVLSHGAQYLADLVSKDAFFNNLFTQIAGVMGGSVDNLSDAIGGAIGAYVSGLATSTLSSVASAVGGAIGGPLGAMAGAVVGFLGSQVASSIGSAVSSVASNLLSSAGNVVSGLVQTVGSFVSGVAGSVGTAVGNIVTGAAAAAGAVIGGVVQAVGSFFGWLFG